MKNNVMSNLTNNYMKSIKDSELLTNDLLVKLNDMIPELRHDFDTQTIWRTETEIRCSVLNGKDFPDNASKYHQAKLEQTVFFDQLLQLAFQFRKKQQELDIKEAEIEELEDLKNIEGIKPYRDKKIQAQINIKKIEKQEIVYGLNNMKKQGEERMRELIVWSKVKGELDDGSFDIDNKDTNELVSLTKRYIQEAYSVVNMTGGSQDTAGYNNIIAQFVSLCYECVRRGILQDILKEFPENVVQWVIQFLNLKIEKR
jgi:hypothetical protein